MKNKYFIQIFLVLLNAILLGCSFVSLDPDAKDIIISRSIRDLDNCNYVGDTGVSLWGKAETFQSKEKLDDQLNILAKNQAIQLGGNTVIIKNIKSPTERIYGVYSCHISGAK